MMMAVMIAAMTTVVTMTTNIDETRRGGGQLPIFYRVMKFDFIKRCRFLRTYPKPTPLFGEALLYTTSN
jgi:hypothetical protein